MATYLGLDIGSNSVGSAWVDTHRREIHLAASVFPAGVDEQDNKRGAPKNQARRQTRSQRRTIHRRAQRKRLLTRFLMDKGLLPRDAEALRKLYDLDPWSLRRRALVEPLAPHEFGRIVIHLAQRRGAVGVTTDPDDPDEGKVKEGMDRLARLMNERNAATIGQLMADLIDERRQSHDGKSWNEPIRNRQYRMAEDQQLFAGRDLIRQEFRRIVERQRSCRDSELAKLLTDDLVKALDDPAQADSWRHGGLLFGQRRTYWDTGTLGRCVLEPSERCAPIADRHASCFRVVETVNNILIRERGKPERPLTAEQRGRVIALLRGPLGTHSTGKHKGKPKTSVSATEIRAALGLARRKGKQDPIQLSIEADEEREINTDWFHREIVHGAIGESVWNGWDERRRESVNRAVLKFDPDDPGDAERLRAGAVGWWGLDAAAADRLVAGWKTRPKLEKRLNLSRRAILNLLPHMERFDAANNRWPTQQEARKEHAKALQERFRQTGESALELAARRYNTGALGLTARDRYYMRQEKHWLRDDGGQVIRDEAGKPISEPPPAPTLSNPVVRKAIHEVRRHLLAWMRKFRRKPDRVVIEMARVTKQSERQRNAALARNRNREKIRNAIIDDFGLSGLSLNQQRAAVDRVILARQQTQICPYCGHAGLTDELAAEGRDMEIDHIVPYSRCGDNGLNNKVLVHRECNRGKANQTPREWWGGAFDDRIQCAEKLFKDVTPDKSDYFTKRDFDRKWQNFSREVREGEEWKNSQLTDTAYAARQVAAYLADALYDGRGLPERGDSELDQSDPGKGQRIFFTMGRFTLMLRKDWQLFEALKPRQSDGRRGDLTADDEKEMAEKNRGDHRQHAIDAAAIALTDPKIKYALASWAAQAAEYYEKNREWPRRTPTPPPWGDVPTFRRLILSQVYDRFDSAEQSAGQRDERGGDRRLIIAHRPVKRRLTGALHEETHYGPVTAPLPRHRREQPDTLFTNRVSAERLTPNHLRVPDGWDELSARLDDRRVSDADKRAVRSQLAALPDPPPGKSGIVRDRALRDRLRKCLRANGLDPDDFTTNQIKQIIKDGKLTQTSGVPIKGVVLLRTNTDPVIIPRKRWEPAANRIIVDDSPSAARVYIAGNNHHIEIREHLRTGKWSGEVVSTFTAATRVRRQKLPAVDRIDTDDACFVMSLAEGEMIYARRKDRPDDPPDYYVVCKLDKAGSSCRIHFAPHWDARKAGEQDRWDVTPADLKDCGPRTYPFDVPAGFVGPAKVHVGPLGDAKLLLRD